MIHGPEQVHDFFVAPVRKDGLLIIASSSRAAAVIHREHDVAVRGKQLPIEAEAVGILPVWSAVNEKDHRMFLTCGKRRRLYDDAVNLGSVRALRCEGFSRSELQAGKECIVLMREAPQRAVFERVCLVGFRGCGGQQSQRGVVAA